MWSISSSNFEPKAYSLWLRRVHMLGNYIR